MKHNKTCQFKPEDKVINTRYLKGESALLLTNPVSPSNTKGQLVASVLKIMQRNTITDIARSDEVILTFGAFFFRVHYDFSPFSFSFPFFSLSLLAIFLLLLPFYQLEKVLVVLKVKCDTIALNSLNTI